MDNPILSIWHHHGRGASIHELDSSSIFYNTNLGLVLHVISGLLEVHPATIELSIAYLKANSITTVPLVENNMLIYCRIASTVGLIYVISSSDNDHVLLNGSSDDCKHSSGFE